PVETPDLRPGGTPGPAPAGLPPAVRPRPAIRDGDRVRDRVPAVGPTPGTGPPAAGQCRATSGLARAPGPRAGTRSMQATRPTPGATRSIPAILSPGTAVIP